MYLTHYLEKQYLAVYIGEKKTWRENDQFFYKYLYLPLLALS